MKMLYEDKQSIIKGFAKERETLQKKAKTASVRACFKVFLAIVITTLIGLGAASYAQVNLATR